MPDTEETPEELRAMLDHVATKLGKAAEEVTWDDLETMLASAQAASDQNDADIRDATAELARRAGGV